MFAFNLGEYKDGGFHELVNAISKNKFMYSPGDRAVEILKKYEVIYYTSNIIENNF